MKKPLKIWLPGVIITGALFLTEIFFMFVLVNTALVSVKLLAIAGVILLLLAGLVYLLSRDSSHKVRTVIGAVLAFILIALQLIGGYYISRGVSALNNITSTAEEFAELGVYVKKDDSAKELSDAKAYTFGIAAQLDRENTDRAVAEINSALGTEIKLKEYDGISELLDGLLKDGGVEAIILNNAFLDLLDELEGHEEDAALIRELYTLKVAADGAETETPEPVEEDDNTFIMYITGIDTRSNSLARRSRSDVNILAAVNTETGQILLVSTPRDFYVPLSISGGIPDKLTHAGIYGTQVSIDTIELLYGIEIDYYFKVNFTGFKEIIDALGGVTVESDMSFSSGAYSFVKGTNELDGEAALAFARDRYHTGGDRARGTHQMAVIKGVINKAVSPALLKNYSSILEGVSDSFETSMPYSEIAGLVRRQLDEGTVWNTVSYSVNGTGASRKPYSLSHNAYVMIPDESTVEKAKSLIEQVKNGEIPVVQ